MASRSASYSPMAEDIALYFFPFGHRRLTSAWLFSGLFTWTRPAGCNGRSRTSRARQFHQPASPPRNPGLAGIEGRCALQARRFLLGYTDRRPLSPCRSRHHDVPLFVVGPLFSKLRFSQAALTGLSTWRRDAIGTLIDVPCLCKRGSAWFFFSSNPLQRWAKTQRLKA